MKCVVRFEVTNSVATVHLDISGHHDVMRGAGGTCGGCDCTEDESLPLLPKTPSVSAASPTRLMARRGMCTFTLQLTLLIYVYMHRYMHICTVFMYICIYIQGLQQHNVCSC